MWKQTSKAAISLIVLTLLLGIVYPLAMTGIARLLFPHPASGSLTYKSGQVAGSLLIGQNFSNPDYFQGRPSAAGANGYDPTSSGGSNLGPTNEKLLANIAERAEKIRLENGLPGGALVPADLVTTSGSGLDPHISPASALLQVGRVARARNLPVQQVQEIVVRNIEPRELGFLGEPRINVLKLNLDLEVSTIP